MSEIEDLTRSLSTVWVSAVFDQAAPGDWAVYEQDTGQVWTVDPPTRENAQREAAFHELHIAMPKPLAQQYANQFNHGVRAHREGRRR